jgi:hypothetical protein
MAQPRSGGESLEEFAVEAEPLVEPERFPPAAPVPDPDPKSAAFSSKDSRTPFLFWSNPNKR